MLKLDVVSDEGLVILGRATPTKTLGQGTIWVFGVMTVMRSDLEANEMIAWWLMRVHEALYDSD